MIKASDELIEESIEELKRIAKMLNKCPSRIEYNKYKNKGVHFVILLKRLNTTTNKLFATYLPEYRVNKLFDISNEQIINEVIEITKQLRRPPMYKELKNYNLYYSYKLFQGRFGSYSKFIESIGYKPYINHGEQKTDKQLSDEFYSLFLKIKRLPTRRELDKVSTVYDERFGTVENICTLLDIDYTLFNRKSPSGKFVYDKNGELCKSIAERKISNFLIDNNIKFKKEIFYSELIKEDTRIFDWKIYVDNNVYYVEYFGMYNNNYNNKNTLVYKYTQNANKKIKDIIISGNKEKCVFIYPDDFKTKNIINIFSKIINFKLNFSSLFEDLIDDSISDEFLLNTLMQHSRRSDYLPSYRIIKEKKLWSIYTEIKRRYGTYENFGIKMDKKTIQCNKNIDFNDDLIFKTMKESINQYGKILNLDKINDFARNIGINGYTRYVRINGGHIKYRIKFYEYCISNDILLPEYEIKFLKELPNKQGSFRIDNKILKLAEKVINFLTKGGYIIE
jgi:hypothetical protein